LKAMKIAVSICAKIQNLASIEIDGNK
jgi:hypothetical protein